MKIQRFIGKTIFLSISCIYSVAFAQNRGPVDLSRLVVVGDSLSAGVQNLSLLDVQQQNGYAAVVAKQAGVNLTLPLVPYPGAPNYLQLTNLNPPAVAPVSGVLTAPRDNPCIQPTNVSVPGVTIEQALTLKPDPLATDPVAQWANIVLGFPSPFGMCPNNNGLARTEIEQAVSLRPTAIIEWLGNNDALVPALVGAPVPASLTPENDFNASYIQMLKLLSSTGAPIITATIPDVTKIAYFTPVSSLASQFGLSTADAAAKLGVAADDLLRPSAAAIASQALAKGVSPIWSSWPFCPALPNLPVSSVPCVLSHSDALNIQTAIDNYNDDIKADSTIYGATVFDGNALLGQLASAGYKADGRQLTTAYLGGIFSVDGIHPTNTGYAIIANALIDVMNQAWHTQIPHANINEIAAHDQLRPPINAKKLPLPDYSK